MSQTSTPEDAPIAPVGDEQAERTETALPIEDIAALPIAEVARRLKAARAARDEIMKRRELQRLLEEVRLLQHQGDASEEHAQRIPDAPESFEVLQPSGSRAPTEAQTDSSSLYESLTTTSHQKHIRPEKLERYRGRNQREHLEFFRSAETAFHLDPISFQAKNAKVLYAMQFLEGEPREVWYRHIGSIGWDNLPTWEDFKDFLLNLIEDPANRTQSAMQKFMDAKQGPLQSAQAFHIYLSHLEAQLMPYSEHQDTYHYFTKLREDLRIALTNYGSLPTTREGMVARASVLEKNISRSGKTSTSKTHSLRMHRDMEPPPKRRQMDPAYEALPRYPPSSGAKENDTCRKCGKKGHWAPDCKSPPMGMNPNHIPAGTHAVRTRNPGNVRGRGKRPFPSKGR